MNLIVLMCDTFRRDHLGCYGNEAIHTPSFDRLASESVVFDEAFSGSFPTLPCRAECFTGRFIFPYLDWGPLPARYPTLSETLGRSHYTCTLLGDNLQLMKAGYNYDRGYHNRIWIRGQTYDPLVPPTVDAPLPCPPERLKSPDRMRQYVRNVSQWQGEEDHFAPQVMRSAMDWIEREHRKGRFFLWIDCFDPHEPWDAPKAYTDLYDPGYEGEEIFHPLYGAWAGRYTPREMEHIRALYKGEVSMVDTWVGKLLDHIDHLGLREDTAIVFLSDHGIYLGDRGLIGKMRGEERNTALNGWATYRELSAIPMMWRVPGITPGRRQALVHPGDLAPTLLDLAGVRPPESFTASSLVPVIRGERDGVRDVAVSSWSFKRFEGKRPSVTRSHEWSYVFWRADIEPELYHRPTDPGETRNVYRENRAAAREMHARYVQFLREQETPGINLLPRLWSFPMTQASPLILKPATES
jgi:arylsulfatase A-like enzyme